MTLVRPQVWAVTMMKDEEDVAFEVLMHLASEGVDGLIVANNNSNDETWRRLLQAQNESPVPVWVYLDTEVGYYQSRKMTDLANIAAEKGAEWIIPFDADELWHAGGEPLTDVLRRQLPNVQAVSFPIANHFPTGEDDDAVENPFQRLTYRHPEPNPMGKVAYRWQPDRVIGQGNHVVEGVPAVTVSGCGIRHFPYRTGRQFVIKARNGYEAYQATDLPEGMGAHWRMYGEALERGGEGALIEHFYKHFWFKTPETEGLVDDPAPFRRFG